MNRYKIEHNGQVFTVEAESPDEAMSFVSSQGNAAPAPKGDGIMQGLYEKAETPVREGDWNEVRRRVNANAHAPVGDGMGPVTEGQMTANRQKEAARQGEMYGKAQGGFDTAKAITENEFFLGAPSLLQAYLPAWAGGQSSIPGAEAHEFIKASIQGRSKANPYSALGGKVTAIGGQIATLPATIGKTVAARLFSSAALGAGMGAAEGAIDSRGDVEATLRGGATGGAFGLGGGLAGEGITRGLQAFRRTPEENALRVLNSAARDNKLTPDAMMGRLNQLGPEAVLADAMGEGGRGLVKSTASLSPEARDIYGRLIDRQAGQNSRVVSAIDEATGYRGQTADAIKKAEIEGFMPQVSKAYDEARAAGMSIDPRAFDDIYNRPMGAKARSRAQEFLDNTKPLAEEVPRGMFLPEGVPPPSKVKMEGVSPLEIADLTKRGLDDLAKSALAKEDGLGSAAATKLAAELRARADELVSNYPSARHARQSLYQREESMDLASKLAGRSALTADDIAKAEAARGFYADPMAKTYGASLAERLNNTRSTPGALTPLDTEFSSQGMRAALGDRADTIIKQIEREREFARTARSLGGSDTADKLAGMKRLASETGIAGGMFGADMMYGTGTGLAGLALAGARKGAKVLSGNAQERRIREAAPIIAQALMSRDALRKAPTVAGKFAEAKIDPRIPLIAALLGSNAAIQAGGTR